MKKFIITEEEKTNIRKLYNLLTEEATEKEIKKKFMDKFPKLVSYLLSARKDTKFVEENGKYYIKFYSKWGEGNVQIDLDGVETVLDGPMVGGKMKWDEIDGWEFVQSPPNKFEVEKIANQNLPCLMKDWGDFYTLRKSSDGDLLMGYLNDGGGYTYFNPSKKTYIVKGGSVDMEEGTVSCDGDEVILTVTKSGTTKKVTKRNPGDFFSNITKEKPIIYGMRDSEIGNDGLITQIQKKLKELRLYNAEPDGQFGPITYKAVIEFQKANKDTEGNLLKPDGKVGPKTIQALGLMD